MKLSGSAWKKGTSLDITFWSKSPHHELYTGPPSSPERKLNELEQGKINKMTCASSRLRSAWAFAQSDCLL